MARLREYTCRILDHVDEGLLNKDQLIMDLLNYMSEDDVKDFYQSNITNEEDDDATDEE